MIIKQKETNAIVIGAGISGLLIALALSKEGKRVLVIEKDDFIGGNCRTYKIDGYSIDTGPHAITGIGDNQPISQLMDEYFSVKPEFLPIVSYYARDDKKGLKKIPLTIPQFATFDILSKKDRILMAAAMMDAIAFSFLNKNVLEKSVYEYIKKYPFSRKARRFINTLSYFLSGKSMYETPAWRILNGSGHLHANGKNKHLDKLRKMFRNSYSSQKYPKGGIQSITDCALSSVAPDMVEFRLGEEVKKIIVENGRAKGVETSSGKYFADLVIYSGFVKDLPDIVDGLSVEYCHSLEKIKQTRSITLWLGLKKKLPELSYIGSEVCFDTDTPYWAMPVSNLDPDLAPKGKQLVGFTAIYKENSPEKQVTKLKEVIFRVLPNIKDNIEFEHIQITIPEKAAVTVGVKFPSPRSPIVGLYLVGTDTCRRKSMGITRVAHSVIEALKLIKEDRELNC